MPRATGAEIGSFLELGRSDGDRWIPGFQTTTVSCRLHVVQELQYGSAFDLHSPASPAISRRRSMLDTAW